MFKHYAWVVVLAALLGSASIVARHIKADEIIENANLCTDAGNVCFGRTSGDGITPAACSVGQEPCQSGPGSPPGYNCGCTRHPQDASKCYCEAS